MHAADVEQRAGTGLTDRSEHAVVVGASMAGMLAARVLADHFERVTVIEPDTFPDRPEPRKGTPQDLHLHILLARGRESLQRYFPGLGEELIAAGAPVVDVANDLISLTPAGWEVRFHSDLEFLSFSRSLLDHHVRQRLAAFERVRFLQGRAVEGLIAGKAGAGVSGVWLRSRTSPAEGDASVGGSARERHAPAEDATDEPLYADLVVDASGRGSRLPRWLADLGYGATPQSTVDAHLGYASRIYEIPAGFEADWRGAIIRAAPPENKRGGVVLPIENGRWLVSLAGGDRDYPPTDDEGFLQFTGTLQSSRLYDALKEAEPLTQAQAYRGTRNRLNHFERLPRWPEGLVALGDSVCAFNPIYGQGMTNAALGAEELEGFLDRPHGPGAGELLSGKRHSFTGRFQRSLAAINRASWSLASNEDHSYESTDSSDGAGPDLASTMMRPYFRAVGRLTTYDIYTRRVLLRVYNMLDRPTALLGPRIIVRVIKQKIKAKGGRR